MAHGAWGMEKHTELPVFRYHPDPIGSGSIKASGNVCVACGLARGFVLAGQPYGIGEYLDCICPWCIADGSAHEKLSVEFSDAAFVGAWGLCETVPETVIEEVTYRTPGFESWQGDKWFTHCGDAAAFIGVVGYKELLRAGTDAIEAVRQDSGFSREEWSRFVTIIDKNGSPTAYLFQCLHCGQYGGFYDRD